MAHPAGEGLVAGGDGGEHRVLAQPGPAAEVVEGPGLEADDAGDVLELEGLDDQGFGDGVEDAAERVLGAVGVGVDVAVAAAGRASNSMMRIFRSRGPSQRTTRPGSVEARKTRSRGASNSRTTSMNGVPSAR